MNTESHASFLNEHPARLLLASTHQVSEPFIDHGFCKQLSDVLSRQHLHHAQVTTTLSPTLRHYFLAAYLHYLKKDTTQKRLRHAILLHFDDIHAFATLLAEARGEPLLNALNQSQQTIIFAGDAQVVSELSLEIQSIINHPQCRFIAFAPCHSTLSLPGFASLTLPAPQATDRLLLLKAVCTTLEQYHQVFIPDELLQPAYELTMRFIDPVQTLDKTLALLDSCAARVSASAHGELRAVLTMTALLDVIADWTHVPVARLKSTAINPNQLVESLQKVIFGQEMALQLIAHELERKHATLKKVCGVANSFIFAGPPHTGKKSLAAALVQVLFEQPMLLYVATLTPTDEGVDTLYFTQYQSKQRFSLHEILSTTPHAVILLEHLEKANAKLMLDIQQILQSGYLTRPMHQHYHFTQATIIMTTTLGCERLAELSHAYLSDEESLDMDLMQLVMNERQKEDDNFLAQLYSPQEMASEMMLEIAKSIPFTLCQCSMVIPILPLSPFAIESILRRELDALDQQLSNKHGFSLAFAPEIMRFLVDETLTQQDEDTLAINTNPTLNYMRRIIEQAIVSQHKQPTHSNRLFLRLNETGQMLTYEWLSELSAVR